MAARIRKSNTTDNTQLKKWVHRYELPESGQYIEFPMTDEEIQAAVKKAEQQKSKLNRRNLNALNDHKNKAEVVEMADGYTIVFYKDNSAKWGYYPIP